MTMSAASVEDPVPPDNVEDLVPPDNIHIVLLGVQRHPPQILVEYVTNVTELPVEKTRFRHRIPLKSGFTKFSTKEVFDELRKDLRHNRVLQNANVQQIAMIRDLIRRIRTDQTEARHHQKQPPASLQHHRRLFASPQRHGRLPASPQCHGRSPATPQCHSSVSKLSLGQSSDSPGLVDQCVSSRHTGPETRKLVKEQVGSVEEQIEVALKQGEVVEEQLVEWLETLKTQCHMPAYTPGAQLCRGRSVPVTPRRSLFSLSLAPSLALPPRSVDSVKGCTPQRRVRPSEGRRSPESSWPVDLWGSYCRNYMSGSSEASIASSASATVGVMDAFESFRKASSVNSVVASFAFLWNVTTKGECKVDRLTAPLDGIRGFVGEQRRFAKDLWDKLNAKRSGVEYARQPCSGLRAVVVGAGPVGLRLALELRLLGCDVIVVEKRSSFDRINRLHLWQWVSKDLQSWGAKIFEPPELSFGADPDFLHIGIHELQLLLLKPCLLLGVQVFFGTEFLGVSEVSCSGGVTWEVKLDVIDDAPGPRPPKKLLDVSVLVGCDAAAGRVAKIVGQLSSQDVGCLRRGAAIGLVVNYVNSQSQQEKARRPFSLARQFYEELFANCQKSTGVELENIVYYKSASTHYFVMTPTKKCLQELGIISPEATDENMLIGVNQEALKEAVQRVTAFQWAGSGVSTLPGTSTILGKAQLFDFSKMKRAVKGLHFMQPQTEGKEAPKLLCGLCGDALIEPFWPEGLGVVRGFFSALDMASSVKIWAQSSDEAEAEIAFEQAYSQLKSLAAKTKDSILCGDEELFGMDPSTRYRYLRGSSGRSRSNSMPPGVY